MAAALAAGHLVTGHIPEEGAGKFPSMAQGPASNNPILSTLVTAVSEAGDRGHSERAVRGVTRAAPGRH
ncbi:hypothetical protein ACFQ1S_00790 [Kibdelosporangium lantanae]|uniref:Uncharacterized protein n=1 Tax=Kibdelosporangium lantanae TaxID=1497396 RepID=A0ABW3M3T5_9PSEU